MDDYHPSFRQLFTQAFALRFLRFKHWVVRHVKAVQYIVSLHYRLSRTRTQLQRSYGADWLQSQFPELNHRRLAKSSWGLLNIAAVPQVTQEYRVRSARWLHCLKELRELQLRAYQITQPASLKIYHAVLTRCVSSLIGKPIEFQLPTQLPLPGGLVQALIRWLEAAGVGRDPIQLTASNSTSVVFQPATAVVHTTETANLRTTLAETLEAQRAQVVGQQYERLFQIEEQELHGAYLLAAMEHLALPTALCTATETLRQRASQGPSDK